MKQSETKLRATLCMATLVTTGMLALPAQAAKAIKDADITTAVTSDMLVNDEVQSQNLDVKTSDGIVTLSGSVDNILSRDKAVEIAESIKGVRAVVNELEVKPVFRTDEQVRTGVIDALVADPATDSWNITVKAKDGKVTLSGKADSYAERDLCTEVAKGVKGVKAVQNDIAVTYKTQRPDSKIEEEVEARLNDDIRIDAWDIDVAVKNGKVTLGGTVGSAAEKSRARAKAWVAGTKSVDDTGLRVEWWAKDPMQRESSYVYKGDTEITKAVKAALVQDPRVWSFEVTPTSEYGTVTLAGTVDNMKAKMAAEDDAKNTLGVYRVKNYLKVRPPAYVSDADLIKNVGAALDRDPYVDRHDITVSAYNGKVYLYGTVDSDFEKTEAGDAAWRVNGVLDEANYIAVRDVWPWKSDWAIAEDVGDTLAWDADVDLSDVDVNVNAGVATLTGTVDTWYAYRQAAEDAIKGGACEVKNLLHVNNAPPTYDY